MLGFDVTDAAPLVGSRFSPLVVVAAAAAAVDVSEELAAASTRFRVTRHALAPASSAVCTPRGHESQGPPKDVRYSD